MKKLFCAAFFALALAFPHHFILEGSQMAIYQPTNMTPSSFAGVGGGVVDALSDVSVSWQVNGNSPMTGFEIVVRENTEAAAVVHTETVTLSDPFYGVDARGVPQFYVYEPGVAWTAWGLSNGHSYKYTIAQTWGTGGSAQTVAQNTETVFITRAAPTLSLSPGAVTSISETFTAAYAQADGDAVNWVRWILAQGDGTIEEDTGDIYTQVLSFRFDRFFNGRDYTLTCIVETENGVQATASVSFTASYDESEASAVISTVCNADDSVTLEWPEGTTAMGEASDEDYGSVSNGFLYLNSGKSVTWDSVDGEAFSVEPPYLFAWKTRVGSEHIRYIGQIVQIHGKAEKLYPGTRTKNKTVSPDSMEWAGKADLTKKAILRMPVNERRTLTSTYVENPDDEYLVERFPQVERLTNKTTLNGDKWRFTWTTYLKPTSATLKGWYRFQDSGRFHQTGFETVEMTDESGVPFWESTLTGSTPHQPGMVGRSRFVITSFVVEYEYFVNSELPFTPPEAGAKNGVVYPDKSSPELHANGLPFAPQLKTKVTITDEDPIQFTVSAVASKAGTYDVAIGYDYTYDGNNAYVGTFRSNLYFDRPVPIAPDGEILSARVISTTADGGAEVLVDPNVTSFENWYTVKFYSSTPDIPSADIEFTLNNPQVGPDSFVLRINIELPRSSIGGIAHVTTNAAGGYTLEQTGESTYLLTLYDNGLTSNLRYEYRFTDTGGTLASSSPYIGSGACLNGQNDFSVTIAAAADTAHACGVIFSSGGAEAASFQIPRETWDFVAAAREDADGNILYEVHPYDYFGNALSVQTSAGATGELPSPVSSVSAFGYQQTDYVLFTTDAGITLGKDAPAWNRGVVVFPQFLHDLNGGTNSAADTLSLAIYREEEDAVRLVGVFPLDVTSATDYGIRSGKAFSYAAYYMSSAAFSSGMVSGEMCRQFRQFSLVEAERDADAENVYHPVRVFRFRNNVEAGSLSNGNTPVFLDNFTRYPLRQPVTKNALSGTLTGLIGYFEDGVYHNDSVSLADAISALSTTENPLFLRDLKGRMMMVGTSAPITQTVNNKTGTLPTTVSIPWVEIGDAEDVSLYTVNAD